MAADEGHSDIAEPFESLPDVPSERAAVIAGIERWALAERERRDSDAEIAEVRRMALSMLGIDLA